MRLVGFQLYSASLFERGQHRAIGRQRAPFAEHAVIAQVVDVIAHAPLRRADG
jgi:hypothetical protein